MIKQGLIPAEINSKQNTGLDDYEKELIRLHYTPANFYVGF
jgi:hypothetical protein